MRIAATANFDLLIAQFLRFSFKSLFPARAVCFLVSSFYVARNKLTNQKRSLLFQSEINGQTLKPSSPELFLLSVMLKREELSGREC